MMRRSVITRCLPDLAAPSPAAIADVIAGGSDMARHHQLMTQWPALNALQRSDAPADAAGNRQSINVAAWNLERCKHVEASADILRAKAADIVLATEMDWGCARSSQRHTSADLATALGMGHVYGVEFLELGLGDARETEHHANESNERGFHGNAVLSRFPIGNAALIPLEDGGSWFGGDRRPDQRRIGGRNAVACEILHPARTFWAVSAHFESESSPALRAHQAYRLLSALEPLVGLHPVVIGGDFNVFELSRQSLSDRAMFATPHEVEPAFTVFAAAGYGWAEANAAGATTRPHPWQPEDKLRLKIDWLFTRGLGASAPWIAPALGADGTVLSDHDAIGAQIQFGSDGA